MKHLAALFLKYKLILLAALKPLGYWGVGLIALLDSSSIPVPMDLIVAGYVWSDRPRAWLYVLMAAIGSAIGGLLPFFLGRAGMRNLGLPDYVLPWYPLLRAPPNLLWHLSLWLVPGGRVWQARRGRRATIAFVRTMTGEQPAQIGQAARHITEAAAH